jgi:four helix bundle protein
MTEQELKERTKQFALRIMKLVDALPKTTAGRALGNQLVRSGTSVGANYRAACRGRSKAEFIAKIGIVIEETDECQFWLELIMDGGLIQHNLVEGLWKEADELTAIFVASSKTARQTNNSNPKSQINNLQSKI